MQDAREYAAVTSAAGNPKGSRCRATKNLPEGTLLTPEAVRLELEPPPKSDHEFHPDEVDATASTTLLAVTTAKPAMQEQPPMKQSMRKRRSIFGDDGDDAEDALSTSQMFSVDATPAIVESTMQPERERIVSRMTREPSGQNTPHRARRVLNLMHRLTEDECGATAKPSKSMSSGVAVTEAANAAADGENKEDDDSTVVRRTWKRRLTETLTAESVPLFPPPAVDRRPAFGRSHSSQSVFLAPSKLSFARSTFEFPGAEHDGVGSAIATAIHSLVLPTVRSKSHPDLNVISPQTVADLLGGVYRDGLDSFSLIDCRFGYEFTGGRLKNALFMNDPTHVENKFLRNPPRNASRTALIFYCEFSANRAPKMLRHVRNLDRWIHAEQYPQLFYPELYLIDGGYKHCYEKLKEVLCDPPQYQPMSDKAFVDQCKRAFATHRANWKRHKANACASTFQQLHRHVHDNAGGGKDDNDEEFIAQPVHLRSFSQLL